jgi:hypothetical protein
LRNAAPTGSRRRLANRYLLCGSFCRLEFVETDQCGHRLRDRQRRRSLVAQQATLVETLFDERQDLCAIEKAVRANCGKYERQAADRRPTAVDDLPKVRET